MTAHIDSFPRQREHETVPLRPLREQSSAAYRRLADRHVPVAVTAPIALPCCGGESMTRFRIIVLGRTVQSHADPSSEPPLVFTLRETAGLSNLGSYRCFRPGGFGLAPCRCAWIADAYWIFSLSMRTQPFHPPPLPAGQVTPVVSSLIDRAQAQPWCPLAFSMRASLTPPE